MTLLSTRRVFTGRVVALDVDRVRFPNGNEGDLEMLRHPGASAVVPFLDPPGDPDPRILLIRQFRHATDGWLWEIPAGRRDGDEPAIETARRELAEETGYRAGRIEPLLSIWTTPGFTDERIHLFAASDLTPGETDQEGDEVLEIHSIRWSEAIRMVQDGTIDDAKTVIALLALQARVSSFEQSGESK
jgi:ADP-ribose pyrophosphatase